MTDTKPDNPSDHDGAAQQDKPVKKQGAAKAGPSAAKRSPRPGFVIAVLILLLIIAALAGTVWYQYRAMQDRDDAVLGQAQQSVQSARAASEQAAQALELARQQTAQIDQMQGSLTDARQHLQSLEQALQTLTDSGTDIALVNDMDHLVSIAHQQLLLGGNVSNAIIALDTAQARLARANRPGLASLQQAINGDLERLRAVSTVDVTRLSGRIDELGRLIDRAPLLIPDDAAPTVASSSEPARRASPAPAPRASSRDDPWWKQGLSSAAGWTSQTWWTIKQDLGSFISVRRVDDAAALLLSPEQAGSLRDKLRLRLMTAQLALLMKQPQVWQTETRAIVELLQARYDINSVEGHRALRLALQLADTSIHVELPSVANSQSAIQALREEHMQMEHAVVNGADPANDRDKAANAQVDDAIDAPSGTSLDDAAPQDEAEQEPASDTTVPQQGEPAPATEDGAEPADGGDSGDARIPAGKSDDPTATADKRPPIANPMVTSLRNDTATRLSIGAVGKAAVAPVRID